MYMGRIKKSKAVKSTSNLTPGSRYEQPLFVKETRLLLDGDSILCLNAIIVTTETIVFIYTRVAVTIGSVTKGI